MALRSFEGHNSDVFCVAINTNTKFILSGSGDKTIKMSCVESDKVIKTFVDLLGPVMILLVGLVIGFIVIAMLLPIFQLNIIAG